MKIDYARTNARIYGVEDRIEFIVGDFFEIGPCLVADAVFLSPPWGGPQYAEHTSYDLNKMELNGFQVYETARKISDSIAYFLPRNASIEQVGVGDCCHSRRLTRVESNLVSISF